MPWTSEEISGLSLGEAVQAYERMGYGAHFVARDGGRVECGACGGQADARAWKVDMKIRIDAETDVALASFVAALRCPACGVRGTATLPYGPAASASEAEVLRLLPDDRAPTGWRRMVERGEPTTRTRGADVGPGLGPDDDRDGP